MYTIENNGKMILVQEMENCCAFLTEGNELINVEFIWNDKMKVWTARLANDLTENEDLMENEDPLNNIYVVERDDGNTILIQENERGVVCLTEENTLTEETILFQF